MTNDERNPRPECRKTLSGALAGFLLRILLFLRISSFVIRICDEWFMESPLGRAAVHRDHEPAGQTLGAPASRRRGRRRSQARFMEWRNGESPKGETAGSGGFPVARS